MRLFSRIKPDNTLGVTYTSAPEGLANIYQPECAATIWQRQPLARFQSWIDDLPRECLPKTRLILRPDWVRDALSSVARQCGSTDCAECQMLAEDSAALAHMFAEIMQAPFLRLRWDVVTADTECPLEQDDVTARLVCTYRGSGTQYAPDMNPCALSSVPTGTPMILRGSLWPAQRAAPLMHRHAPFNDPDEARLVLTLDPVFDPDTAPDQTILH